MHVPNAWDLQQGFKDFDAVCEVAKKKKFKSFGNLILFKCYVS